MLGTFLTLFHPWPHFPADTHPGYRHLPSLPNQQGAGAEGGPTGAAGARVGVRRPGAGSWLRACLPGHPPGLCAHRPRSGLSATPAPTTTSCWVSHFQETPISPSAEPHLPDPPSSDLEPQGTDPKALSPSDRGFLPRADSKRTEGQDLNLSKNLRLVFHSRLNPPTQGSVGEGISRSDLKAARLGRSRSLDLVLSHTPVSIQGCSFGIGFLAARSSSGLPGSP